MLGPTRPVPRVGCGARIAHFGGGFERVRVIAVSDHGRRLAVIGDAGEELHFALSPATAKFVGQGAMRGARLELLEG
jgi:hypothetical protein